MLSFLNQQLSSKNTLKGLMQTLEQMANLGIPIDAWQEKSSGSNWGNSNNNGYKKRW